MGAILADNPGIHFLGVLAHFIGIAIRQIGRNGTIKNKHWISSLDLVLWLDLLGDNVVKSPFDPVNTAEGRIDEHGNGGSAGPQIFPIPDGFAVLVQAHGDAAIIGADDLHALHGYQEQRPASFDPVPALKTRRRKR